MKTALLIAISLAIGSATHYEKPIGGKCSNGDERAVGVMVGG